MQARRNAAAGATGRAGGGGGCDGLQLDHPQLGTIVVGPVEPTLTYALRHKVLRPHQRVEDMGLPGADHPDALVVGASSAQGEVVGTGAVTPEPPPDDLAAVVPAGSTWRLRSMATRPDARGAGIGAAVLAVIVAHVAARGGGVLWCSARTPALSFYERAGFVTFGDVWEAEHIGPHVLMWRVVHGSTGTTNDGEGGDV